MWYGELNQVFSNILVLQSPTSNTTTEKHSKMALYKNTTSFTTQLSTLQMYSKLSNSCNVH